MFVGVATATEAAPREHSGDNGLAGYLKEAALNNPGLEAAFHKWKAELQRADQSGTFPNPRLTYAYFIDEVETRVGPQEQKLGISQVIPWFGTVGLREDVATAEARAAYEEFQAAKLRLFYDVKRVFYEYFYLSRAIAITEDNIRLLTHLEGVARSKQRAGGPLAGVIKAQVELGKLEDRLQSLTAMREPLAARFNAALNRPHDTPVPWPNARIPDKRSLSDEAAFVQLTSENPDLKALDNRVDRETKAVALARKAYFPNLVLGVETIDTGGALMPGTAESGKDPLIAMVALDIPLWVGKNRAGVEEAAQRRQAAEAVRTHRENLLRADLSMALYRFRDAERKIDLYGHALIPQAEQGLKVAEEAYRSGTEDFLDLIDAERLFLEFTLSFERALVDREIAFAEIEMLTGQSMEESQ